MFLLFETIKVINKKLLNVSFHNERINRSRRELFGSKNEMNLNELVEIPNDRTKDIYKCKVIYSETIKDIEFRKYAPRKIERVRLVYCNEIDYSYKFLERSMLDKLLENNLKNDNEDILIIKNGRITDTSYSNVALFNGKEWHTPKFPLLKGTKRAKLIFDKRIYEQDILAGDLEYYEKIVLINAMLEFDAVNSKLIKEFIIT